VGELFGGVDWHAVFTPTVPLMELVVRGTIMYFVLFGLLRLVPKRQAGAIGMTDILVIVLLADVASNAFSANYTSVVEGTVLVATILFWSYVLDWVAFHWPAAKRLLHAPPLPLIEDGKLLRRNLKAELVTMDELMSQLREHGIEDCAQVKRAFMEPDGAISVVKMKE
jgi:uncharacterized membrane protein YcaP (DUF421 family)